MSRPCSVCHHIDIAAISRDIANGVTDLQIARRYSLSKSALKSHRAHLGAPNVATVIATKSAAFTALAALPSREEAGSALSSIGERIDRIAARAETEGSLAVALMGLRELKGAVVAQATLAGHLNSGAQVQVNTQVNVDLGAAVKEIIAALRPPPDAAIPPELAVHLGDADVTADALARLEAVIDGE